MNRPTRSQCIRVLRYQQAAYDQGRIFAQPLTLRTLANMTVAQVSDEQTRLEQMLQT